MGREKMEKKAIKKIVLYGAVFLAAVAFFVLRMPELRQSFVTGTTHPYDFPQDYLAGRLLLTGKSLYPPDFMHLYEKTFLKKLPPSGEQVQFMNAHPPFTALLLFPLWFLHFHNAALAWAVTTIGCLFLIILLLLRSEDIPLLFFLPAAFFALAWEPFQLNLSMGQTSILVTLFVIAGWYFLKKNRDGTAGIVIAMATMLKFYPGLLIVYLLISRRYKAFVFSIIGIGSIVVLMLLTTGNDFFHFLTTVVPYDVRYWVAHLENFSISGFATKLFLSIHTRGAGGAFTASLNPLHRDIFLYLMDALLLVLIGWRMRQHDVTGDEGYSIFIIAALLMSPLCWDHYLTLLLLPLAALAKGLYRKPALFDILLYVTGVFLVSVDNNSVYFQKALTLAHALIRGNPLDWIYRMTFFSAPFYGMLILLFLMFKMLPPYRAELTNAQTHKGGQTYA